MKLDLERGVPNGTAIVGKLSVDGEFFCYTLESTQVDLSTGVYSIEMTYSPHFQRQMPLLDSTGDRTAIRIHPGNTVADTEGCILVGNQHTDTTLGDSRAASDSLNTRILSAIVDGQPVTINITACP